ncbi:PREDICTED: WAP four-disulfide core domain protein 18-like [Miniopterus natalensis]|uniref:WAP four-disulfide core domain protein 18-like n=1 Tax=Miniopterus natalensis TaxID=291302 RepID=UPI0007A6E495|nr:PREDICTED: WAP four-disulfide core domain protein 18-like [Miniopterus natalensis]
MKTGTVFVLVAFIAVGMEMAYARIPIKDQRPGFCPEVPKGTFGICIESCSGDGSCPKGMKCCSNGCGHVCKTALRVKGGSGGHVEDGQGVY